MSGGLGDLLGAYGSGDESSDSQGRAVSDVVAAGDHDLDLSHLTGAAALRTDQDPAASQPSDPQKTSIEDEQGAAEPSSPPNAINATAATAAATATPVPGQSAQQPMDLDTTTTIITKRVNDEADLASAPSSLPDDLLHPPPGTCDPDIQDRVARWLDLQSRGRYLADQLRASRDYRNPEFFRKMVEYWEINEYGTCFSPEVYDPTCLPEEDRIQALQQEWAQEETRRRTVRATTGKMEFTKGGMLHPNPNHPASSNNPHSAAVAAAQAQAAALAAALQKRR